MRGFTLVELLVVLVIFGILATAVTLTIETVDRSHLNDEARRLGRLMEVAVEESRWSGVRIHWYRKEDGYGFERIRHLLTPGQLPPSQEEGQNQQQGDDPLRPRQLPEAILIKSVELNGIRLSAEERIPFIAGIPPLFRIVLADQHNSAVLQSQADGVVNVERAEP